MSRHLVPFWLTGWLIALACGQPGLVCESNLLAQQSVQATSPQTEQTGEEKTDEQPEDGNADEHKPVVIKAHFLAATEHQIASCPEEWTEDLRVEFCVPHGARVRQGDVLVRLRSRKLENAIWDQQQSAAMARLAAKKGHMELEHLRASVRLSVTDAERAERIATEDLKRFVTQERDQRKEELEYGLKNSQDYLAYQEEELKQLLKMYEADDLTEETEEIVLRRTRDDVERSRQNLTRVKRSFEKGLEIDIPRSQEQLEDALRKASVSLEKVRSASRMEVEEKELGVEKLDREASRAEERLTRLNADLQWLTLKAPASGLVYYGEQRLGVWPDPAGMEGTLKPGGTVKPNQVLLTVVEPAIGLAVGTVGEADLPLVSKDRSGKLTVPALPGFESDALVTEVSSVPISDGKFLVRFQPNLPANPERIVPGMTCEITFEKKD